MIVRVQCVLEDVVRMKAGNAVRTTKLVQKLCKIANCNKMYLSYLINPGIKECPILKAAAAKALVIRGSKSFR